MIRKSIFAVATTAIIVASALPTAASAKKWGNHSHGGLWIGAGVAALGAATVASCYQYQWVETRRGLRQVLVNVCED